MTQLLDNLPLKREWFYVGLMDLFHLGKTVDLLKILKHFFVSKLVECQLGKRILENKYTETDNMLYLKEKFKKAVFHGRKPFMYN